ncbi:MAG: hypothetical protein L7H18_02390 [Candidatus Nealsonbacteria bacterium DGGOD1a]|nr:MAG: hypothetical protein L7H18_02390 [Candidatus Nealsonbacteria bacterium DGGOD1a]
MEIEKNLYLESVNGILILDGEPTRYGTLRARIEKPFENCLLMQTWVGTGCAGEDSTLIVKGEFRATCRNIAGYSAAKLKILGEIDAAGIEKEGYTLSIFGILHIKYI